MAAYAALASLMNNIEQIMNHPRLSSSFDERYIQPLLEKAGLLLDFIEGYIYGAMSKGVEDLERRIASAAHAAEDVIESHVVDQIHAGSNQPSLHCSLHLQQIVLAMDYTLKKANELKEKEGLGDEQPTHSRRPLVETVMVGFEEELIQLMDELTNQQASHRVISITGMGGTGKTTLAKNAYDNLLIKQHFDIRAWANVSDKYNVQDILSQLLSDLRTAGQSGDQLHKTLFGRRYFIVLDDIWSVEAWDEVMRFFPDNGNRSRVVLTTRLSNVARDSCSSSCFRMKPLDKHKSWELLCKKAFQLDHCPYPELERVGKEITSLCSGLPLSIIVIGGLLLKLPRSLQLWENIARNIESNPDSKENEASLDILSLSYDHLPPHLKPCFLYMGVFTEHDIHVSKIIKLWIAEGFLRPNKANMLEEAGESYLNELIDRNMISAGKRRKNGKIGSCSIHDLMIDLCLKVGEDQQLFQLTDGYTIRGSTERRVICPFRSFFPSARPSLGRSILARESLVEVAANRKLLRVWDTKNCLRSPERICGNVNLRYLAFVSLFERRSLWELPNSVSLVWNLKTLIVRESDMTTIVAPIEIWKMQQLRDVECSRIYLPSDGLSVMDNLQTLTTAVNFRLSHQVCEMIPNVKKLHLLYQHNLHGYDGGFIERVPNIHLMHKLESLNLSFKGDRKLLAESELNKKLAFPASLNKLSLSGCRLEWEDMSKIASLPQLEVLVLGISSVMVGSKWSLVDEQFMRLKYLKIDWCNLHCWEADSFNFPVLEKLILSGLRQLEEIPWGIGEIPTLELIRVEYSSESSVISALKIKEDQVQMGNEGLETEIRISFRFGELRRDGGNRGAECEWCISRDTVM